MSPVALFAFNRPDALRETLSALSANPGAEETDLFVFVDGPRRPEDVPLVSETKTVAASAVGFKSLHVTASPVNKGLASSIIDGVSRLLTSYDTVIVLEDDLRVMPSFLAFMNEGLCRFRDCPGVFSVCGHSNRITLPADYRYNTYFAPRSSSWGWATWRDRWEIVDWQPSLRQIRRTWFGFNHWGGSDCSRMLFRWAKGRIGSWAIRFCYAQYRSGAVSLFPVRSLVDNSAGFDGKGTNCHRYSRFKFELDRSGDTGFRFPPAAQTDRRILRRARWYHSLPLRLYSRIMYVIKG